MGVEFEYDDCIRKAVKIFDENYYLTIGRVFVTATVPRENDPAMSKEREVVETLCQVISDVLEIIHKKEEPNVKS